MPRASHDLPPHLRPPAPLPSLIRAELPLEAPGDEDRTQAPPVAPEPPPPRAPEPYLRRG